MASLPRNFGYHNRRLEYEPNHRRPSQRVRDRVRAKKKWAVDTDFFGYVDVIDRYLGLGLLTVRKSDEEGLSLERACALREQESAGQNIFGCDHGDVGDQPPYCGQRVTEERVQALRANGTYKHGMNGIGETQVTWWEFVEDMEELGGAHLPGNQFTIGFRLLAAYLDKYPALEAYGAYNAGETNRRMVINSYSRPMARRVQAWRLRLYG